MPQGKSPVDSAAMPLIDMKQLCAELDAMVRDAEPASPAVRQAMLDLLRRHIRQGRAKAEALLFEDGSGLACAERLARMQDRLIVAIHDFALRWLFKTSNLSAGERMAIVAVGGYGRGTLAPGSDIDLLFLLPYKQTPLGEQIVEYLLYMLWDLGFKVGHATRTVEECVRLSRADLTIRTALLERWLIVGDETLFAELDERFETEVVTGTEREFIEAKLAERDARHAKTGDSRYLVEPNVKEGKGGLRDLHTLFWIAKYFYRVRTTEELIEAGVFSRREGRILRKAEDFLYAVRCHMHFMTGKAEERLSFDIQPDIAARLGYSAHAGLKDVERFMKHYFLIAKDVGDLTGILCAALEDQEAKEAPGLRRFMLNLRHRSRKIPGTMDFLVENGRIMPAARDVFQKDPVNLIRVFRLAAHHELEYHPDTLKLVRRSVRLVNAALRENKEANSLFLDVLTDRRNPEPHLRRMNEAGVLGRFVPDFGRIVAMMQFNMYHHYTVDEHLLRSIAFLSKLERGECAGELPLATEIVEKGLKDRVPLYVALLLHDIAKGRPEDHSVAGARIARELCPRLGLDERETELVSWLVEDHLVFSLTAQQRDINDRKTILDFADRVRTLERLKLLLVLTVCDINAVGPGVWNGWKGQLMRSLYLETEPTLTGGFSHSSRRERLKEARAGLLAGLADWSEVERESLLELHYPNYLLAVPVEEQLRHARFIRETGRSGDALATMVRTDAFQASTEITILAPDHPRLLSIITGACAAAGGNIADAQIFTLTDGRALDVITLNRAFDTDEDELRRAERIRQNIANLLQGRAAMPEMLARHRPGRASGAFKIKPRVSIDNDLSNQFTVVEIEGLDRPGLLSDLTGAMSDLNLDIRSAHITTWGERIVDVFYLTDLIGMKITSENRAERIERRLLEVFEDPSGEVSSRSTVAAARAFGMPLR